MKIGFFIDGDWEVGGIFQQKKENINKIIKYSSKKDELIIIVKSKKISQSLNKESIKHIYFKDSFLKRIFLFLYTFDFFQFFFTKFKISNPFEKFLKKNQIDLLVFNSPSNYIFYARNIHYVINIWNTEIKNYNFFPEFIKNASFKKQDLIIKEAVLYSFKIIVFSKDNIKDLQILYNCPQKKITTQIIFPYLPTIYEKDREKIDNISIDSLDLKPGTNLFLYPAQFYAHKNHKYLIEVAANIKDKTEKEFLFIFTGIDKGNLSYLKKITNEHNLNNKIKFFENLENEYLIKIYLLCDAVISSTYIGKLSLPLLEAFYFKKPIFYSKNILDSDIEKRTNIFDLKNVDDLSNQLVSFMNDKENLSKNLRENREFYDLNCSSTKFAKTYQTIFDEFRFYASRWKQL